MNNKLFFSCALGILLGGCASTLSVQESEIQSAAQISFSKDMLEATIITDAEFTGIDSLLKIIRRPPSSETLIGWFEPSMDESLKVLILPILNNFPAANKSPYIFSAAEVNSHILNFHFIADTNSLRIDFDKFLKPFNSLNAIEPLFQRQDNLSAFLPLPSQFLVSPCKNLSIPGKTSRLPNAPREYRFGIHRGIDFFSNWGTPVRSVADGIIIRSDLNYKEISPDFREYTLEQAKLLNRTPSDIFNSVLLGRTVIIDHGFDLFNGYRSISIYAHLSHINRSIKPGYEIKSGEIFASTGNSGTKDSALGTKNNSHLHWELILHDSEGEYYLGQGAPFVELQSYFLKVFKTE